MNASKVIDPPAILAVGRLKHVVLVLASGLIGGLAVGFVVVVLQAILSDRLWLRVEVGVGARRAGAPQRPPAGPVARIDGPVGSCRGSAARRSAAPPTGSGWRQHARAGGDPTGRRPSLAVLCLDNSDEMRFGVVAAASLRLRRHGRDALIVDLTARGDVHAALDRLADVPGRTSGPRCSARTSSRR